MRIPASMSDSWNTSKPGLAYGRDVDTQQSFQEAVQYNPTESRRSGPQASANANSGHYRYSTGVSTHYVHPPLNQNPATSTPEGQFPLAYAEQGAAWRPGFLIRFPFLGIASLFLVLGCMLHIILDYCVI